LEHDHEACLNASATGDLLASTGANALLLRALAFRHIASAKLCFLLVNVPNLPECNPSNYRFLIERLGRRNLHTNLTSQLYLIYHLSFLIVVTLQETIKGVCFA
jgi:hypothetical protein